MVEKDAQNAIHSYEEAVSNCQVARENAIKAVRSLVCENMARAKNIKEAIEYFDAELKLYKQQLETHRKKQDVSPDELRKLADNCKLISNNLQIASQKLAKSDEATEKQDSLSAAQHLSEAEEVIAKAKTTSSDTSNTLERLTAVEKTVGEHDTTINEHSESITSIRKELADVKRDVKILKSTKRQKNEEYNPTVKKVQIVGFFVLLAVTMPIVGSFNPPVWAGIACAIAGGVLGGYVFGKIAEAFLSRRKKVSVEETINA